MKIALCDDEKSVLKTLHEKVLDIPYVSNVKDFRKLKTFRESIEDGEDFDVVLMDIDWNEEVNGIDVAERLFEKDPSIQVIFVTGYNEMYSQSIFLQKLNLCGYLVKPVNTEYLDILLKKAAKKVSINNKNALLLKKKGEIYAIPFEQIIYLESRGHQVTVHSIKDHIQCYEQLEKIKKDLPEHFMQCHKSYIVNMNYIEKIEKNRIYLTTGADMPISKAKYGESRKSYFAYMGRCLQERAYDDTGLFYQCRVSSVLSGIFMVEGVE